MFFNLYGQNRTIYGVTKGHALSYHICTDNKDEFKIILCDPFSPYLSNCL